MAAFVFALLLALLAQLPLAPLAAADPPPPAFVTLDPPPSTYIDVSTSTGHSEGRLLFQRRGRQIRVPARAVQVPILMYHYIRVNPDPADRLGFNLSVTPADFAAQLAYLANHGYHTIGLDDLASYLAGEGDAPAPGSLVLSFDDGYRDAYQSAFPLLKKYGFRGTVFMIAGLIGQPNYLTAGQLREMADAGMTIGAHTINHPDLTTISTSSAQREVAESKAMIEKVIERPVRLFNYPSGKFNNDVASMVKAAGYVAAVTVNYGLVHKPEDRFTLSRVRVSGGQAAAAVGASAGMTGGVVEIHNSPAASHPFGGHSPE